MGTWAAGLPLASTTTPEMDWSANGSSVGPMSTTAPGAPLGDILKYLVRPYPAAARESR